MATRIILTPGDVFAGYTIEQLLGGGGMGNVYRAREPDLPRSVALKLLHRDLTSNDYIRARFELEGAHAARLEHPNIVTVYRRGREEDQLWIAMQFIDTTDAAAAVSYGALAPAHAVAAGAGARGPAQPPRKTRAVTCNHFHSWPSQCWARVAWG